MSTTLPIEWVAGTRNIGSAVSKYTYYNHDYSRCGGSKSTLMCGNNYYVNSTLIGSNQYSVNDKQTKRTGCAGAGGCPEEGCGLDYSVCPNIGGVQAQVQWASFGNGTGNQNSLGTKSTVACLYPLATFNDLQTVLDFANEFGDTSNAYTQQILPQFCASQTTLACPINPGTGQAMEACSRYVSAAPNNPCPNWLKDIAASDIVNGTSKADEALFTYCDHYNTPDCLCINRFYSPVYQVMSYGQTADTDSCWWTPCKDSPDNPTVYLVPRSLPACVADNVQVCNDVNIAVGGNSNNLTFNPSEYTKCDLTPTNNNNGGNTTNNSSLLSYWWVFLIAIIAIIIVIFLMIFIK